MRKKNLIVGVSTVMALLLLASAGCIDSSLRGEGGEGKSSRLNFEKAPISFEIKRMRVDRKGVLWMLSHNRKMYALDPDLRLSELAVCGEGIEDFALAEAGEGDDPLSGYVFLAAGDNGLSRMDRRGQRQQVLGGDSITSVYADGSSSICAGGGAGFYSLQGEEWDSLGNQGAASVGAPTRMVRSPAGVCFEVWDNRLQLLVPGQAESVGLEVSNEQSVRVVDLLSMSSGQVYLVTSQGLYRLEEEAFRLVQYSEDPIMSAAVYAPDDILLGKNSGTITAFSPLSEVEKELGFIDGPVEHLGFSTAGLLYVHSGLSIYLSRDMALQADRLTRAAAFKATTGAEPESPVGIHLSLPVSESFSPEWFYLTVRAGTGNLYWGLDPTVPGTAGIYLEASSGEISVEALAVASRADTFRFVPGDSYPFPEDFPEEAWRYLSSGAGIPLDQPETRVILDSIPPEVRGDMYALLMYLIKQEGIFYQAPYDTTALPAPSPESPEAEEFAIQAASRVLRGEGGDDYARALALTSLCRAAGLPARLVLSFDHFLNQVYINGAGWIPVDVSGPVFDLVTPSYPTAGRLPGGLDSFITATGGVDDDLRYLEIQAPAETTFQPGTPGAPTVIFCRPGPNRLLDESEAIPMPDGGSFYFREKGAEYLLVKKWSREEEEVRIYQNDSRFPLTKEMNVGLYMVGNGYIVIEGPEGL